MTSCRAARALATDLYDGASASQLGREIRNTKLRRVAIEDFEHDPGHIRCTRQRVSKQLPHRLRHATIVSVRPIPGLPRTACNVNLDHTIQRESVERFARIEPKIDRVAVQIVQIEQLPGSRA